MLITPLLLACIAWTAFLAVHHFYGYDFVSYRDGADRIVELYRTGEESKRHASGASVSPVRSPGTGRRTSTGSASTPGSEPPRSQSQAGRQCRDEQRDRGDEQEKAGSAGTKAREEAAVADVDVGRGAPGEREGAEPAAEQDSAASSEPRATPIAPASGSHCSSRLLQVNSRRPPMFASNASPGDFQPDPLRSAATRSTTRASELRQRQGAASTLSRAAAATSSATATSRSAPAANRPPGGDAHRLGQDAVGVRLAEAARSRRARRAPARARPRGGTRRSDRPATVRPSHHAAPASAGTSTSWFERAAATRTPGRSRLPSRRHRPRRATSARRTERRRRRAPAAL